MTFRIRCLQKAPGIMYQMSKGLHKKGYVTDNSIDLAISAVDVNVYGKCKLIVM